MKIHCLPTLCVLFVLASRLCAGALDESAPVFNLGERFFNDSLYSLALEQFQKYITLNRSPDNDATAWYKISVCQFKMDNMRKAAEAFETFISGFPADPRMQDALFCAGVARKKLRDYKEASDWFYMGYSRFVGSAMALKALFEAAESADLDNNPERAIELYELFYKLFKTHEQSKVALLSLCRLLVAQKDFTRVQELITGSQKTFADDAVFHARLLYYNALCMQIMQNNETAVKYYQTLLSQNLTDFPEYEQALTGIIGLLQTQRKYEACLDMFKQLNNFYVKKNRKIVVDFLRNWSNAAVNAKRPKDAEKLYRRIIADFPEYKEINSIYYLLAQSQIDSNDMSTAITTLEKLAALDTNGESGARAVKKIGDLHADKGSYISALNAYRRYVRLPDRRDVDEVLFTIGTIYQQQFHNYVAALREYENIVDHFSNGPAYFRVFFAIAECHEALKNYPLAIQYYEFVLGFSATPHVSHDAEERIDYLKSFCVKNAEAASYALADLVQKQVDSLPTEARLLLLAAVFRDDLKDYPKAIEVLGRIETLPDSIADSVRAGIMYEKAQMYEKLGLKAQYEHALADVTTALHKARSIYTDVCNRYPLSAYADEATFRLLMTGSPSMTDFEAFVSRYPAHRHTVEVLFSCAHIYESGSGATTLPQHSKAKKTYADILKLNFSDSANIQAHLGLARCFASENMPDSVVVRCRVLTQRFGDTVAQGEALLLQGDALRAKGNYDSATELLVRVVSRFPLSKFAAIARYELGVGLFDQGKIFDAYTHFKNYVETWPGGEHFIAAQYGIARCLVRLNKVDEAQVLLLDVLSQKPDDTVTAGIHYELGTILEKKGDVTNALVRYKKSLAFYAQDQKGKLLLHMADLYFDGRQYTDAARVYDMALKHAKVHSDSMRIMSGNIASMIMDGKGKTADKRIAWFKESFPQERNALAAITYYEGLFALIQKNYDAAIKRFKYIETKFDESDRSDDAAYQTALCYFYTKDNALALRSFEDFLMKYPLSEFVPLANFKVALLYHNQNEFSRAAESFARVAADPKTDRQTRFRAISNAAVDYQKVSEWISGVKMYERLLADFPDESPVSAIHLKIGFCLVQASRYESALEHFQKAAVKPNPEDKPEIQYWIANCLSNLGETQRAITEYIKVPYLYSGSGKWGITAEFEAARLYEQNSDYLRARTLYSKIVAADGTMGSFGKQAQNRIDYLNQKAPVTQNE